MRFTLIFYETNIHNGIESNDAHFWVVRTLLECDVYVADRVTLSIFIVDGRRHSLVLSRVSCLHAIRIYLI